MKRHIVAFLIGLVAFAPPALALDVFPLADVRPGLTGTGKTCVQGREIAEFKVEVLGLLRKAILNHDVVLVRVSGLGLEKTGIFAGMSGSPVYIDGKLLGALAYGFPFATEPIAGVTPFAEMQAIFEHPEEPPPPRGLTVASAGLPDPRDFLRKLAPEPLTFTLPPAVSRLAGGRPVMQPLQTPLMLSGFSPASLEPYRDLFQEMGFTPMLAGGAANPAVPAAASSGAAPGAGLVVNLIQGDLTMGAGGTITAIDGDTLYAFGHQLLAAGVTSLPMCGSETVGLLPNLNSSFKFFTTGAPLGTIQQDRLIGIQGKIGVKPDLLPVNLTLVSSRDQTRTYRFEVARDKFLSALLLNYGVFNLMVGEERSLGFSTVEMSAAIRMRNGEEIRMRDVFSQPFNTFVQAAQFVALPVQYILLSGFSGLEIDRLDLTARVRDGLQTARIDDVWASRDRVRPGETVTFRLTLITQDNSVRVENFPLTIPAGTAPGPIQVFIGDGATLSQLDQQLEPGLFTVYTGDQLLRALKHLRQSGTVYLKMYRKGEGVFAQGEALPALPPSYLDIFGSKRTQGAGAAIRYIHYLEESLGDKDFVVTGSRTFQLTVEPY